jgi:hypothetical protein
MSIIWQELRAIMSDTWDEIVKAYRILIAGIAANYQLIIVAIVGLAISLPLMGIPFLATLIVIGGIIVNPFTDSDHRLYVEGNFIGYVIMFCAGLCALTLTVELHERIEKRMKGKPKDDASTESEGQ